MNLALVSILTTGSDLNAQIGAISLMINNVQNVWRVTGTKEFTDAAKAYAGSTPIQTEERVEAMKCLENEKWPRKNINTALDEMNQMIKDCRCPFVIWDFDPVSFIDAHAFLWTKFPECRPAIRRVEGELGNFFLSGLACFKGWEQGHVEYNGFFSVQGRAAKAHSLMHKFIRVVQPDLPDAPQINPGSNKGTEREAFHDPSPSQLTQILPIAGMSLPGASTETGLTLPDVGATKLTLPGM